MRTGHVISLKNNSVILKQCIFKTSKLERWLRCTTLAEANTHIKWLPQLPITPGDSTPSSGFCRHQDSHEHAHTQTGTHAHAHTQKKFKIFLKINSKTPIIFTYMQYMYMYTCIYTPNNNS